MYTYTYTQSSHHAPCQVQRRIAFRRTGIEVCRRFRPPPGNGLSRPWAGPWLAARHCLPRDWGIHPLISNCTTAVWPLRTEGYSGVCVYIWTSDSVVIVVLFCVYINANIIYYIHTKTSVVQRSVLVVGGVVDARPGLEELAGDSIVAFMADILCTCIHSCTCGNWVGFGVVSSSCFSIHV